MPNRSFDFERSQLEQAISATLMRYGTGIPEDMSDGLTTAFAQSIWKLRRWEAFRRDITLDSGSSTELIVVLEQFLMLAAKAAWEGYIEPEFHGRNSV